MASEITPQIIERIRQACIKIAQEAYEDAGLRGLCHEGRWEVAIDALKHANHQKLINQKDLP